MLGNNLFLVRGLPGSGKSTLASRMVGTVDDVVSADDFFMVPRGSCGRWSSRASVYEFDPTRLSEAHDDCLKRCRVLWSDGHDVAVANTFSQRWELEPYLQLFYSAENSGHLFVVDLFDGGESDHALSLRTVHGVPVEAIARMRARWDHDWQRGDPQPPRARGSRARFVK